MPTDTMLELRPVAITPDFQLHPAGSVLIEAGRTRVLCAVTIEEGRVPPWMRAQNIPGGWLTAEYQMLPSATGERGAREAARGKQSGRTLEIQRLIGRSLRAVVDLEKLGKNTVHIDCDVIDADGGTRCAAITGASVALEIALRRMFTEGKISEWPMREHVAAVSVGLVAGKPVLDLCYEEDSTADVDMNVVMTASGGLVEVQGTAEGATFSRDQMNTLLDLAEKGLNELFEKQQTTIKKTL